MSVCNECHGDICGCTCEQDKVIAEQAEQITTLIKDNNIYQGKIMFQAKKIEVYKQKLKELEDWGCYIADETGWKCSLVTKNEEQAEQITAITKDRDYSAQVAADLAYEIGEHKETIKELLLADTKNTEICEKFEAQLIQANLDIIRLEKRNEDIQ